MIVGYLIGYAIGYIVMYSIKIVSTIIELFIIALVWTVKACIRVWRKHRVYTKF